MKLPHRVLNIYSATLGGLLRISGISALCFVIQACYGVPQSDFEQMKPRDLSMEGVVPSTEVQTVQCIVENTNDTLTAPANSDGSFRILNIPSGSRWGTLVFRNRNGNPVCSGTVELNPEGNTRFTLKNNLLHEE